MICNKELIEILKEQGLSLIGYMPAQSPIYVLNLKYLSKDKDPFYPIDRSILSIINETPDASLSYIAWLIGFEKEVVESRVNYHLIKDGFLSCLKGEYVITESGHKKYLNNTGERPDVEVTGSIMVDGTTLRLLPPMFYETSIRFFRNGKTNIPHYPILGLDDKMVIKAIKHIEKSINEKGDKYGLEESAHDLEVIGADERYIEDIYIIIVADKSKAISKRLYFNGHFTMLPSISESIKKYFFTFDKEGKLHHNYGVTTKESPDNIVCDIKEENIFSFLANRYKVKDINLQSILSKENSLCPVTITITEELLKKSPYKEKVMADARKGIIEASAKEGGYLFIPVNLTPGITNYLKFEDWLNIWKEGHEILDMDFIESIGNPPTAIWRKMFCTTGHYKDLEAIDINSFFRHIGQ